MMAVPLAFDAMTRAGSVGFMARALNDAKTKRANELLLRTFMSNLTPELSRTALRPWASENQWYLHEAAKRARLERIVRFDSDELVGLQLDGNLLAFLARRAVRFHG